MGGFVMCGSQVTPVSSKGPQTALPRQGRRMDGQHGPCRYADLRVRGAEGRCILPAGTTPVLNRMDRYRKRRGNEEKTQIWPSYKSSAILKPASTWAIKRGGIFPTRSDR
jgi:hypothetical protein